MFNSISLDKLHYSHFEPFSRGQTTLMLVNVISTILTLKDDSDFNVTPILIVCSDSKHVDNIRIHFQALVRDLKDKDLTISFISRSVIWFNETGMFVHIQTYDSYKRYGGRYWGCIIQPFIDHYVYEKTMYNIMMEHFTKHLPINKT